MQIASVSVLHSFYSGALELKLSLQPNHLDLFLVDSALSISQRNTSVRCGVIGAGVDLSSQPPRCVAMHAMWMTTGPCESCLSSEGKSIAITRTFLLSPALLVILMEV